MKEDLAKTESGQKTEKTFGPGSPDSNTMTVCRNPRTGLPASRKHEPEEENISGGTRNGYVVADGQLDEEITYNADGTFRHRIKYSYHRGRPDKLRRKALYGRDGRITAEYLYEKRKGNLIRETEYEDDGSKTSRFFNRVTGRLERKHDYYNDGTVYSRTTYMYDPLTGKLHESVTCLAEGSITHLVVFDTRTGNPMYERECLDRELKKKYWECYRNPDEDGFMFCDIRYNTDGIASEVSEHHRFPKDGLPSSDADYYSPCKESLTTEYDPVTGRRTVERSYFRDGTLFSRTEYDPLTGEKTKETRFLPEEDCILKTTIYYAAESIRNKHFQAWLCEIMNKQLYK